jgi:hypothetical protein
MSEQAKPPPRKRSDFWGTIPQWISAGAALGILYLTATGLKAAKPIFENAELREENAQLRLDTAKNIALLNQAKQAVADQTTNGWRYVCRHFATKALAAAAPDIVLSALKSGEIDSLKQKFPLLQLQTGAALLRSDAIRDELALLSAPDRKRFEQMIEKFITDNGPVMNASLDAQIAATGAGTQPPTIPEADRAKQARQAFDQAMQRFIVLCNAAAGTP